MTDNVEHVILFQQLCSDAYFPISLSIAFSLQSRGRFDTHVNLSLQGRREGGAMGASVAPTDYKVHFFVDQRFGRLELGTLLKDQDDQHCRLSWSAAANPVNNTNCQLYFYFCAF